MNLGEVSILFPEFLGFDAHLKANSAQKELQPVLTDEMSQLERNSAYAQGKMGDEYFYYLEGYVRPTDDWKFPLLAMSISMPGRGSGINYLGKSVKALRKGAEAIEEASEVLDKAKQAKRVVRSGEKIVPNTLDDVATQALTGKYAKRSNVSYRAADEVNATFPANMQPPYKRGTRVTEFETTVDDIYVRVHRENNKARSWIMKREALEGLTPEQIKSKYALPELPTYMSEVHVPAGTKVRTGTVNPLPAFDGLGNATQYELLQRLPESAFKNTVRLGQ